MKLKIYKIKLISIVKIIIQMIIMFLIVFSAKYLTQINIVKNYLIFYILI
jgi:hypothetical protein